MAHKKRKRTTKAHRKLTPAQRMAKARVHVASSRKTVKVSGYVRGWPTKRRKK